MAEFNLPFGVRIANNDPVDFDRYIAADLAARAAIVSEGRAYEGLQVYVESEQKLYVLKTVTPEAWQVVSTSMIEDLKGYIDGSLNNKLNNTTDTFTGTLTIDGSVTYINSINLDISDNIIQINSGMSGTPPSTMVSGMRVNRGTEDPYFFIFSEDDDTFRVGTEATESGLPGNTQAVATREDDPADLGIPYWNETEDRFDTSAGFTFSGDNKFTLGNFNLTDNAGTIVMSRGAGAFLQATTSSTSLTAPGQTTSGFFASSAISRISNSQIALGNTATFNTFVTISNLAGLNTLIDVKGYGGSATSVFKIQKNGEIYCPSIGDAYQSKVLYYDELSGRITSGDASFGGGSTIEGSTNVIPVFNSAEDNIENSNFKISTNIITKADGTGNLVIESGETGGDLHLKTYANASADFYLDPRNGTIVIGKDHSILNAILRVGGLGANGNFTLEPKGTGRMVLKGGLELSNISEAKRNQILYYNTTDQTVTYGDGNIGTTNYVPKFNSAGDGIEDSSAYFTGDTLFVKDLQIDNNLFTKSGTASSTSGTDFYIKAGNSYTTGGGRGRVIISGGDNLTSINGAGGEVYIGPGKQYSTSGNYIARVFLGTPEYNSTGINLTSAGINSNISLRVEGKGTGATFLGKSSANTFLYGAYTTFVGNGAGSFAYSSSGQYLRFQGDHSIVGLDGNSSTTPSSLTLKPGDSSIGGGLGGNLTLGPGEGRSGGIDGSLYIINIPVDVSTDKVLYYNSTNNEVTAGDAPSGGGIDVSLGTVDQIPFMKSTSNFEYSDSFKYDGTRLIALVDGALAVAIGSSSTTSTSGVAIGHAASATNGQSTAVGPSANSSGNRSVAIGASSTSRASSTIAIGDSADAANNYSIAIGSSSVSSASNSIAIGTSSKSSNQYNISIGDRAGNSSGTVNANAISIGRNANDGADDIGLNSVALGVITVASGQSAIAIGEGAESVASYMIAIGNDAGDTAGTIAPYSISLGYGANAGTFGQNRKIGQNSIGVGTGSKSPGTGSIGIGLYCDASADYSVSLSPYAYSYGVGSMALGRYSIANAQGAIIMGYHTLAQTNDLSDSFKLMWDGVTGFHTGKTLGTQIMVSDNPETNLIDASNGSLVYDSSNNEFKGYKNGSWDSLGGGSDPNAGKVPLVNYGSGSNVTFDLGRDTRAKYVVNAIDASLLIDDASLSSEYSHTMVLDITGNTSIMRTLIWDPSLSSNNWVDGDVLSQVDNTSVYVVTINTNGNLYDDILINYVKKGI